MDNEGPTSALVGMATQQLVYEGAEGDGQMFSRPLTIILPKQVLSSIVRDIISKYQELRDGSMLNAIPPASKPEANTKVLN